MCTNFGTRYAQCGNHLQIETINHCRYVNKKTWTCPANEYVVINSERYCPRCHRSLNDSVHNLFHKMQFYGIETYTPTPEVSVSSTPNSEASISDDEDAMEM